MVAGLPNFNPPTEICEDCIIEKQARDSFPTEKSRRGKRRLELVHSYLCGPINLKSNGGKCYIITFIDDFSRKTWVYFLQEKSEAFAAFKSFKALIENDAQSSIKILRSDWRGEYNSREFIDFCELQGIKKELMIAYSPQQNGVSERKNCTISNIV